MQAETFHCPSCGAAISGDATQCRYCASQLQTVACASCFGLMFLGSKFCPHCGAAAAVADRGLAGSLPCPRCTNQHLREVTISGILLDKCREHGIWLDRDELRRVIEFIRAGGLTVAREREIEELKRQRQGLESDRLTASVGSSEPFVPTHTSRYISDGTGFGLIEGIADVLMSFMK